jgi:uncharacterized membrane protein YvlD (DUF360 family)
VKNVLVLFQPNVLLAITVTIYQELNVSNVIHSVLYASIAVLLNALVVPRLDIYKLPKLFASQNAKTEPLESSMQ